MTAPEKIKVINKRGFRLWEDKNRYAVAAKAPNTASHSFSDAARRPGRRFPKPRKRPLHERRGRLSVFLKSKPAKGKEAIKATHPNPGTTRSTAAAKLMAI